VPLPDQMPEAFAGFVRDFIAAQAAKRWTARSWNGGTHGGECEPARSTRCPEVDDLSHDW